MKITLNLYKENTMWFFDNLEEEIIKEPFVGGTSEIITELQKKQQLFGDTLVLTVSDKPFYGMHTAVIHVKKELRNKEPWNLYYCPTLQMYGWLCPVLYVYFKKPPNKIFIQIN